MQQEKEVPEKNSIQRSDVNNLSCQNCRELEDVDGMKQNIIVQQKNESSVVQEFDSVQANQSEANAIYPERNAFSDKLLESDRRTTHQQKTESPEKNSIFPAQDLIQKAEQDVIAAQQENERIATDNQIEANRVLQQRRATPTKLLNFIPKAEGSHQTCKDGVNVREEIEQKRSMVSVEESQTWAEDKAKLNGSSTQGLMLRELKLRAALANFFYQQKQAIEQQAEISYQENIHSSRNWEGKELQKPEEIATPRKSKNNWQESLQELKENATVSLSESGDGGLARSQGSKEDTMAGHPETKEGVKLEYRATILARVYNDEPQHTQPSKGYVTLQRPKSDDMTTGLRKSKDYISGIPQKADNAKVSPQKTKDYVSLIPRELDAIAHSSKAQDHFSDESDDATRSPKARKDYVTLLPGKPNVIVQSSKTKDYVTVHRPKSDTVTILTPFFKDYATFKPHKSHDATMDPQKVKDYVTVCPREADDVTARSQKPKDQEVFIPLSEEDYIFVPSSQLKGYVIMIPAEKDEKPIATIELDAEAPEPEPPTHIFWPVRRFQENAFVPETPIQGLVPPRTFQGTETVPESKEPQHVPIRTRQMKEEVSPSPQQALSPQCQTRLPQAPGEDLSLASFVESSVTVFENNDPELQRNRTLNVLLSSLPTGMREFGKRIRECPILRGRQASFKENISFYYGLLYGLVLAAALYFLITFILSRHDTGNSNVTSLLQDFHVNLNISKPAVRHSQNQSLDSSWNVPVTSASISAIDFSDGITTPVINLDVGSTTMDSYLNLSIIS